MKISGSSNVNKGNDVTSIKTKEFWKIFRQVEAKIWVAVIFSCVFFGSCSTPTGLTTAGPDKSTGRPGALKEVAVFVEVEKPSGDFQGINRTQLQSDIETRMRQAGVKVVPQTKTGNPSGVPIIYVNVTIAKMEKMYAYNADIILVNTSAKQHLTAKSGTGTMGTSGLVAEITQVRGKVVDLVNLFIKDHLSSLKSSKKV